MRILLDECVPRPFRREMGGHEVFTSQEMGWAGKKNGVLLKRLAEHNFDALVTVDQNLRHQHDLSPNNPAEIGV